MTEIKEEMENKKQAFLLQFGGNESYVRERMGMTSDRGYGCPVRVMERTGFFGILEALIDLNLTNREIRDFYIHQHLAPYDDPCEFTKGIIEIVYGMSKNDIKNKYGQYFTDERIAKLPNPNRNTQMLLSFCYDKEDTYEFIPNKKDLYHKFVRIYDSRFHASFYEYKEEFQKIDGKLFRVIRFLVRQGYDFPDIESLTNEQVKNITLKQTNGKNVIELNKDYAREISDNLLCLVYFFDEQNFEVPGIDSLCEKKVETINLKYIDSESKEHSLIVRNDILVVTSQEFLKAIKKAFEQGFTFSDGDNLFDTNQELIKVIDPNGKEQLVVREQFNSILEIIILLINNGYSFKDYSNLFDENHPYIVSYDEKNQVRLLSRKQLYKLVRLQALSDKERESLTDSEKDLLLMLNNSSIRKKLFEWLPYTAKKWIPSAAVINKIPAEQSDEYFYNNNHARLKVLKDEYQASNYDEMEGIVSLGYILGLFDSKESTSEKAVKYIINYFLKKGVTADELHTTYGAIDLKKGYNKDFADFFMKHYAIDKETFIDPDLGTNMVGELFEKFDEVLKNRPEKRIKTRTRNQLLTPIDAIASITDIKIDREMLGEKAADERYIRLIGLLMKFGAGKDELKWAMELYEQALAIDEQKVSIPQIEDLEPSLMKFTSHLKSDPQAFISGRKTNCCSKYGGFAQDRLTHVITDINWRYVTFTSPNRTFFDGLVWYDEEEQVVCIDNVEGQFSRIDKSSACSVATMADTVIRYADGIYHKMNELNIPCVKVNVGRDPGTASWEIFKYASEQKLINDDTTPCNYPTRNGISTDALKQFTITDAKILGLRKKIK